MQLDKVKICTCVFMLKLHFCNTYSLRSHDSDSEHFVRCTCPTCLACSVVASYSISQNNFYLNLDRINSLHKNRCISFCSYLSQLHQQASMTYCTGGALRLKKNQKLVPSSHSRLLMVKMKQLKLAKYFRSYSVESRKFRFCNRFINIWKFL